MPWADKHPFFPLQLDQISFTLVSHMISLFLEGCTIFMLSTNLIMLPILSDPSEHFFPSPLSSSQHSYAHLILLLLNISGRSCLVFCTSWEQHVCGRAEVKGENGTGVGQAKAFIIWMKCHQISVFQRHNAFQSCIWFCGAPLKAGDSPWNKSLYTIWPAQNGVKGPISLQLESSGMKSPSILGRHAMWTAVIQCPTWKQSGRKQSGLNPKLDF